MQLIVRARDLEVDQETREHLERRLRFALNRFLPRISRVTVFLADENGVRGGIDKSCRVLVRFLGGGEAAAEVRDGLLLAAIDRAAARAAQAVGRTLTRLRDRQRSAPEPVLSLGTSDL